MDSRRLPTGWGLVLVVALACLLAALPSTAAASPSQVSLFEAPRELMSNDDALRQRTLDDIEGLGVHWVRVMLFWRAVAPSPRSAAKPAFDETDPGAYPGFARYDRVIGELRARGMNVLLTLSGPVPKWATQSRTDYVTRPNVSDWEQFVTAVGRRYQSQIGAWSIWNEPNHPAFLGPQFSGSGRTRRAASPAIYRGLFLAADRALNATGNGSDLLLMGETAPRGTGKSVAPLVFLRGVLCLSRNYVKTPRCGLLPADGYAHHAYTTTAGPTFHPSEPDDVTIGVLSRLTTALDRAARAHALKPHLPLYLTEFGIQSWPDPFIGVSLLQQAEYRSIAEKIAYENPRVRMFSQYLMRDDDPRHGSVANRYSGFESGLRLAGGRAKPAYAAYRLPLVVHRSGTSRIGLWGLVRPHDGRARLMVQVRSRRSSRWLRLLAATTGPSGYWSRVARYRRGAVYRVVWTAPSGTVYRGPPTRTY